MEIIKVIPRDGSANSYILTAENNAAVVIDPSNEEVIEVLSKRGLKCGFALLTHGHFDHVGACGTLFSEGVPIICGREEREFIFSPENLGIFGGVYIPPFEISRTVSDGEKFTLCGIEFTALHTAGHTAGSYCYIAGGTLFSGDTLFESGVGRTDLPTGNGRELIASVKRLVSLGEDMRVCPGHGSDTTLKNERNFNPFIR